MPRVYPYTGLDGEVRNLLSPARINPHQLNSCIGLRAAQSVVAEFWVLGMYGWVNWDWAATEQSALSAINTLHALRAHLTPFESLEFAS